VIGYGCSIYCSKPFKAKEFEMPFIIKEENGKEERYFNSSALLMILELGFKHGWKHQDGSQPLVVFSEADSQGLCTALIEAVYQIAESYMPDEDLMKYKHMDSDSFIAELVKRNLLELIDEFLRFCSEHPFRINYTY
jgi:hypothetical protein